MDLSTVDNSAITHLAIQLALIITATLTVGFAVAFGLKAIRVPKSIFIPISNLSMIVALYLIFKTFY